MQHNLQFFERIVVNHYFLSFSLVNFLERKTETLHKGGHHYTGVSFQLELLFMQT